MLEFHSGSVLTCDHGKRVVATIAWRHTITIGNNFILNLHILFFIFFCSNTLD